jgi:acyl-CoA reductase-like NAD-dependent aldehyde dehydrogenase
MSSANEGRNVRVLATHAVTAGNDLWNAGVVKRAEWLSRAFQRLRDPSSAVGRAARERLPASTGLSEPMVNWALDSALSPLTADALCALARSVLPPNPRARMVRPGQLCVVVLAGNVFTAGARGAALPLLFGWPVLAKASSHDDAFAHLLEVALTESDPVLGEAFRVVTFAGDDITRMNALFEQADAVSAYGSDRTLNTIRAELSASVSFIPHGHGLGAALIDRGALTSRQQAHEVACALALDVVAYDQRGCMSPLVAWVVRGGEVSLDAFADLLFEELDELSVRMPRGRIGLDVAGAQVSWRGVGAMRGRLLEGDGYAVCVEEQGNLRLSPGHRNVQLLGLDDLRELPYKLAPLGVHLKTLGVAGVQDLDGLMAQLPARVAPRICPAGSMQLPPLDALQDGVPAWDGLVRWAEF